MQYHKLLSRGKCWSHQERCFGSCPAVLLPFLHAKMAETWQTLPADVSPAPLSCQKVSFLSSFLCSVQGPTMFVLGIAAADHFREIQGIGAFKPLCLVLLCSLCFAAVTCECRSMTNLTCDQWQETPELPVQICAVSHGASPSAVCLLGNLLLRSP